MEEAFDSSATELAATGHIQRASLNLAWAPSEFSAVRAECSLERVDPSLPDPPLDTRISLQFIYSIGAHPAHAY